MEEQTPAERRAAMTPDQVRGRLWAQRLERVLLRASCPPPCGRAVRMIGCIEDPDVIEKILTHLADAAFYQDNAK